MLCGTQVHREGEVPQCWLELIGTIFQRVVQSRRVGSAHPTKNGYRSLEFPDSLS